MKLVNQKVYIVKPGDTLSEIANHFCGAPAIGYQIAEDSGIINAGHIYQGQRIWIREEFLKEEFKGAPNTQPKEEPFREGQHVRITPSGKLTRLDLHDLCWNTEPLAKGFFVIVETHPNQTELLVQDDEKRHYYFNLNELKELVRVRGALEISPNRFMPFS